MPNDPRPIYVGACDCPREMDRLYLGDDGPALASETAFINCTRCGSAIQVARYSPDEWTRVPGGEFPTEFALVDVTVATADGPRVEVAYHVDGPLPWGGWAREDASELPGVIAWRPRPLPAEQEEGS